MSFGRSPHYIYEWHNNGVDYVNFNGIDVPKEAVEQFVASLAWRGTDALQTWVDAGVILRQTYDRSYEDVEVTSRRTRYMINRKDKHKGLLALTWKPRWWWRISE